MDTQRSGVFCFLTENRRSSLSRARESCEENLKLQGKKRKSHFLNFLLSLSLFTMELFSKETERGSHLAESVSEGGAGNAGSYNDDVGFGSTFGSDLAVGGASDAIISDLIESDARPPVVALLVGLSRRIAPKNVEKHESHQRGEKRPHDVIVHHYRHIRRIGKLTLAPSLPPNVGAGSPLSLTRSGTGECVPVVAVISQRTRENVGERHFIEQQQGQCR